jgi:hypothetical protein
VDPVVAVVDVVALEPVVAVVDVEAVVPVVSTPVATNNFNASYNYG